MTKKNKEKLEEIQYYTGDIDGDTVFSNIQSVLDNNGENDSELYYAMQDLENIKEKTLDCIKILQDLNENLEED